ncbi:MAG: MurR/RpiR family transcriptional regulator [Lawsonibacter sp.]
MFNKISEIDGNSETEQTIFALEMEEHIASIRATLSDAMNQENLTKLLTMMDQADRIYITGGRASGVLATLFANILRYLDLKVYDLTFGVGDYLDRISMIEERDLVIALSFPRYTTQVIEGIQDLHEASVPIVLITDTGLSPAYPYADLVFHCPVASGGYFHCYAGCLALISAICRAAGVSRKKTSIERVRKLESHLLERGVFTDCS